MSVTLSMVLVAHWLVVLVPRGRTRVDRINIRRELGEIIWMGSLQTFVG